MKSDGGAGFKKMLDSINLSVAKLYHIATHDQKTGIYNYIFFKDIFGMELEKARRGKSLSLLVIDIDFFKKINDTYGHLQADKILVRLAQLLKKQIRKYDVAARFGGEEFFVMFPNTKLERAGKIAERLRKSVLSDSFLKKYKVSISGGVSEFKAKDNLERISTRADKALYSAKKGGRNRICLN